MAVVLLVEIVRRLARREAGVDLIAMLSIVAALVFEQTLVAAVIALMLASGRTLEFFTAQRADRELRALVDRAPRFAWLQEPNDLRQIPVEQIQPGQTLLVRLGEVVPVDGRLLSPTATLDESALSGESLPVTRREGEVLRSGVANAGAPFQLIGDADGGAEYLRRCRAAGRGGTAIARAFRASGRPLRLALHSADAADCRSWPGYGVEILCGRWRFWWWPRPVL